MLSSVKSDHSMDAILELDGSLHSNVEKPSARRRRTRTVFSQSAIKNMEREFEQNKYPDIRRRESIAAEIGVSEARVQVWFQNRRARHNKRRHSDDNVPMNTRKRQRVEQPPSLSPDNLTGMSLPIIPLSYSSTVLSQTIHPQIFSAHQPIYYHGNVLPSLWNLQSVITSFPQETKKENDASDDFVKRLFRFSARDAQEVGECSQKKPYRMVVPTKKATDCPIAELRVSESDRNAREECVFTLDSEDSGLANDSFSDSV